MTVLCKSMRWFGMLLLFFCFFHRTFIFFRCTPWVKALWEWRWLQWETNFAHLYDCISCEVDYVFCVSVIFNFWLFHRSFPVSRMAASVPTDLENRNSWEMWSVSLDPFEVGVCLVAFIGVFVFVKLRHREPVHLHLPLREFVKGHSFVPTDLFAYPSYCNICEENVVEGFQCGKVLRLIDWSIDRLIDRLIDWSQRIL